MKKFLVIQFSCIFWSSLIASTMIWLGGPNQHLNVKTISFFDENGVRRIFVGIPPGGANPPTIQMLDPSGNSPLLTLAAKRDGAEVAMLDKSGQSALELEVANQNISIHGRNKDSNGGIHLSVTEDVPLIALANREEKPQIGLCVTDKGGQIVMGDNYGFPSMALTSRRKDCSLVLQDVVSNRQKSITYNSEAGSLTYRDSKDDIEIPLDFPRQKASDASATGLQNTKMDQRWMEDGSDYLSNVKPAGK